MDGTLNLQVALAWLERMVAGRLRQYAGQEEPDDLTRLELTPDDSALARFVRRYVPTHEELLVLLLGVMPHVDPQAMDALVREIFPEGGELPALGGVRGQSHRGLLPTGETALFVLAGTNLDERLGAMRFFSAEHWFAREQVLWLDAVPEGEPAPSGRIIVDPELIELLTTGVVARPRFSHEFPAEHITTAMTWDDLVLHTTTMVQIREIEHWITHNETVMQEWGLSKRVAPGYRALFHGPPGTGKTLTATLLGKHTGRDVFRIDLSRLVSKYIGDTEKNLARLFDRAEHKDWILFFDEADALFSKRTDIRDAHDKYANQEVAYLLQRVESFDGLVILATNQRSNIDEAFSRRFQSIIHFPAPTTDERFRLWSQSLPQRATLAADLDLREIATAFEVTGAAIASIVHHCSIEALAAGVETLDRPRLEASIRRELTKEGRVT